MTPLFTLAFIRRHLDPAARLGEVLFGLIMALGFTAAVRITDEPASNRDLFVAILGCNVAWAVVDGVMYVLGNLFERGRKARIVREVRAATDEQAALAAIAREVDGPLMEVTSEAERRRIARDVLAVARRAVPQRTRVRVDDLLGGTAVALAIVVSTLPVVAPFVLIRDTELAVRASNAVGVAGLALLGARWGQLVGGSPLGIGFGLTLVGLVLVGITIVLGG